MFSLRNIIERVVTHGRKAFIKATHVQQYSTIFKLTESSTEEIGRRILFQNTQRLKSASCPCVATPGAASGGKLLQYLGPVTLRFIQGIVRKVPSPLWVSARRKTTQRLFGETAPYFALVGVTLASGTDSGLLTEKDQLEALCGDIREAVSRAGWIHDPSFWTLKTAPDHNSALSLADLQLGPVINKGCNAVVYSAKWRQPENFSSNEESLATPKLAEVEAFDLDQLDLANPLRKEAEPSIRPRYHSLHEEIHRLISTGFQMSTDKTKRSIKHQTPTNDRSATTSVLHKSELVFTKLQSVITATNDQPATTSTPDTRSSLCKGDFPLALKMLFNYEAESNASSILAAMKKELIPSRNIPADLSSLKIKQLPPHANIVDMQCVFVDRVPLLDGGLELYPQALPKRIHSAGFGRNMSLFCVMKRYDCTLSEYLSELEPSVRTSCLLLTQLLEAVEHLAKYRIAHRDLKSDNILLDLSEGVDSPRLVVSDFGCCLTTSSLKAPFPTCDADPRLGNLALMAPEVRGSSAGLLTWVNFGKVDLWSTGAIALDMFGIKNPFVEGAISSLTYKESQVPKLPKNAPSVLRHLASGLLRRNPHHRPGARIAATLAQLSMWAPTKWLHRHTLLPPSHSEVTSWLLCLSTKVLCEAGGASNGGRLEYEIVSSFLSRVHYDDIINAIAWIRSSS